MKIQRIVVGYLNTNCYIISKNGKCIIIDPGDEYDKIKNAIGDKKVISIIITHYHFDHIGALKYFKNDIIDYKYKDGKYFLDEFEFNIIHTKGHKEDSITIYFEKEKVMFTGDFIFNNSIGRVDLEGGNIDDMKRSLHIISKYNDDIVVYPGHGENTLLGIEKQKFNLYL